MIIDKRILRFRYVVFDIIASLLVWLLFMIFRRLMNDMLLWDGLDIFIPYKNYYWSFLFFPILCISAHYLSGYYSNPIKYSKIINLLKTLTSSFFISLTIFFLLVLDDIVINYQYYYQSFFVLFFLLFLITTIFRVIQTLSIIRNFKKKKWAIKTLIVGTGRNAKKIAAEVEKNSIYNTVVGFVKYNGGQDEIDDNQIIGRFYSIDKIIKEQDIDEIIVALDDANENKMFEMINKLFQYNVSIQLLPKLYQMLTGRVKVNRYGINPLINLTQPTMSDWEFAMKRTLDFFVSLISLVVLSPFIFIIAIFIKLDSPGSVFFKQERIGLYGKPFFIYKFRTMHTDAEKKDNPQLSSPNDDRITSFGRFLRKYRLDEIPQFFNILMGQMSLVGPRPERQFYIEKIVEQAPYYFLLYRIPPGLTSWGPIKIGYSNTVEQMIKRLNYDVMYMENMTLATDLRIILSTFEILFKGKGV